jgi:hypothetical protein
MPNLKELLKDYITGEKKLPVKITNKSWGKDYNEVIFIGKELIFVRANELNEFIRRLDSAYQHDNETYEFYEEPKKKIKLAPYYRRSTNYNSWYLTGTLFETDADFIKEYPSHKLFKRCTALEIEVDEELK